MIKNFGESIDPQGLILQRYRDSIKMPVTKSTVQVLNSDSMNLDGGGYSLFIEDEFAAAKSWDIWNVLVSGQGFQEAPLGIAISSANFLLDGFPCFEWRKTCMEILKGEKNDDSTFAALYELDEDDKWESDESCWIKANPSLGVTVSYDFVRSQVTDALNQTALEFSVKTKTFNIFCQSSDTWIPSQYVKACMDKVDIADFKDEYCYMGVDLSAVSDLCCWSVMFPPNESRKKWPDKYVFKSFIYVPESTYEESVNKQLYKHWVSKKVVTLTNGNVVDYDKILKDQIDLTDAIQYADVAYDSWNATQWAINATNAGLPLSPFSQSLGNFNKPTKYLEMLIRRGDCVIDENIAVVWMFNNVKLKIDLNENCKCDKPTSEAKIDVCISMTEALGSYLNQGGIDVSFTS